MSTGKTYSTKYLLDTNNNRGSEGQVLISTSEGVNWSDGSDIIGGPYLPLSAGSSYPLTGDLYIEEDSLYLLNASNDYWKVQNNSSGKLTVKQGTTQRGIWSSGELQLANNLIVDNNVGIGTTNPTAPLDVFGVRAGRDWALSDRAVIRLDSNGAGSPSDILFGHTAAANQTGWTGAYWSLSSRGSSADNKFYFYRGGGNPDGSGEAVIMTFDPNLNVGIGTTGPNGKLTIKDSGFGTAYNNYDALYIDNGSVTAGSGNYGNGIGFSRLGSQTYKKAAIAPVQGTSDSDNLGLAFFTSPNSGFADVVEEAMRINYNGNVGIGTTNPTYKLHVDDNNAYGGILIEGDNAPGLSIRDNSGTSLSKIYVQSTSSSQGNLRISSDDNNTATTPTIEFRIGNSEKARISDAGNVGIGTTSPLAKLHIKNSSDTQFLLEGENKIALYQDSPWHSYMYFGAYNNNGTEVYGATNRSAWKWFVKHDSDGSPQTMSLYGANQGTAGSAISWNTVGFSQDEDGNVGIGTTNPSEKLVVDGKIRSLGDTSSADFYSTGNDALIVNNGTQNLKFWNNGSERMRIKGDGNVGIGTTNPEAKLGISQAPGGTAQNIINSSEVAFRFSTKVENNNVNTVLFRQGIYYNNTENATIAFYRGSSSVGGFMTFQTQNGNERMRIASNGNVGIGNTGPVNGKLVVTSGIDGPLNTVRIQHTRDDADVDTRALEIDMNLSGADTTTGDRTNRGIFVDLDSSADGDASNEHRIHGIESDVRFTGFSDIVRAGQFYAESGNITEKTAQLVGVFGQAIHDANSTNGGVSNMYGVYGYSQPQDLGDVDTAFGGYFLVNIGTNRGNADIGVTKGVEGEIQIDKSSTISYGEMMAVSGVIDNNEGTVPTFGNQYLFKGDYQGTRGDNAWGVHAEGDKHYFEGKVGIGTIAPTYALSVQDSVNNADVGIHINNTFDDNLATSNPNAVVFLNAASNNGYLRVHGAPANTAAKHQIDLGSTAGSSFLTFSPGGAERMRIATDGNVGIGTTSPLTKLQIDNQGQGEFSGANSSAAGKSHIILKDEGSTSRTLMSGPSIVFQTPASGDGTNVWASSRLLGSPAAAGSARGTFSIQVRDNYDPFNDGTSWNWRTALTAINSGNVGIGTNSPSQKLHVAGRLLVNNGSLGAAAGSTIYHAEIAGARHRLDFKEVRTAAVTSTDWKNTTYKLQMRVDSTNHQSIDFVSDASYNEHIDIYTGNQVFNTRFNANGNVGIGTTSPGQKLEVSTSVYEVSKFAGNTNDGTGFVGAVVEIETNNDARGRGVYLTHREDTDTADSEWYAGVPYTGGGYSIGNAAYGTSINSATGPAHKNQSKIFIKENGDVGIGTTSPTSGRKLDVHGDIQATEDIFIGAASSTRSEHKLKIGQNRSDNGYAYIDMIGDAGAASNYNLRIIRHNSGANALSQIIHTGTGNFEIKASNGGDIILNSSGSIGISQTSPSYKLDVTGDGRFTSTVTATNFILSSDERLKENVEKVCNNRVKADWKTFELKTEKGQKRYGVIAQQLEKTNPEFVREDSQGFKSVAYIDLLIAKIAELEARLEKLEK